GYYGATVHNVKAVYQKYLGWFDNNPAKLWELPGKASAELYAKYLRSGGSLLQAAQSAYADGQYRWVVEALEHIRLAPDGWGPEVYRAALELQADAFEQMAYSAESGIWRNYFLTGAWRNRLFNGLDDEMIRAVTDLGQFPGAAPSASKPPTRHTTDTNAGYIKELPFNDTRDRDWAERGFIAHVAKGDSEPLLITGDGGRPVWDMSRYAYISGDISAPEQFPDTVNPSLWRNAILNAKYGLFEVASRDFSPGKDGGDVRSIYQVRGYDLANMSFVETKDGFIAVDVTSYEESAAAAVKLLYSHLPEGKKNKKIHTIIITHSHADHYGGIRGVLNSGNTKDPAIVAPDGFWDEAVSENVTVGEAMRKRAVRMYGLLLEMFDSHIPEGRGQVNNGVGIGSGAGKSELVRPTLVITQDGSRPFDGTRVDFMLAPDTEAPSNMAVFFPDYNSICLADICLQTQHNVLTPRGAQVRDTQAWLGILEKMKRQWVDNNSDTSEMSAWGQHNWPRWGRDAVAEYIDKHSLLYRHLHDETVRLMNEGLDMKEIAEVFEFPANLANEWFNRGYYGTTVHNVKAVYQGYLGWFDNNPATLWELPDKASAEFYAKYLSGGNLLEAARRAYADGNYRWVTEVLEHIRLAPNGWGRAVYTEALELQADAFEQMAYSAESGIWRNYFLTGTWRNRDSDNGGGGSGCAAGPFSLSALLTLAVAALQRRKR
ncbi:MAG: MBL fold metallo-hydrolase, partial [Synergistaceae bacterium]|nr:MBL fold metallo-hydrolase [Synergistaceae bacterium]